MARRPSWKSSNSPPLGSLATPPSDPDGVVIVARVVGAHGRDGALNVRLLSDVPGRFDPGRELLVDQQPYTIAASRQTGPENALIWLRGIATRARAMPLTGKFLTVLPSQDDVLDEGEYFHYQLIGMRVRTDEGEDLGEVQEILETGSNDVYIVRGTDGELLIPATTQVVREVDVAGGVMTVHLPDGLR